MQIDFQKVWNAYEEEYQIIDKWNEEIIMKDVDSEKESVPWEVKMAVRYYLENVLREKMNTLSEWIHITKLT